MQKLIFIVDDNDTNLTITTLILDEEYRVLTMSSAEKMFSLLEKKRPDLILLDIEMPQMDGFKAIKKLQENPEWKDIPVIFLTGLCDEQLLQTARKSGALDIISKPILPQVLLNCIKKYL